MLRINESFIPAKHIETRLQFKDPKVKKRIEPWKPLRTKEEIKHPQYKV